jgi:hypothetical protein
VTVDPAGMVLKLKRSSPRRMPPTPSVPASNQPVAPALLPAWPLLMNVSSVTVRLATAPRPQTGQNNTATQTLHSEMLMRVFIFATPIQSVQRSKIKNQPCRKETLINTDLHGKKTKQC